MTTQASKHLNARQIKALDRMGDILLPGYERMPAFSATGCTRSVDRILDYMPASDLGDLKTLLTLLSFFPGFILGWFLRFLEKSVSMGNLLGAPLRFVRLGIRGLIMTLYYSDPKVHQEMGYKVGVYKGV